jgi:hypothetical protein
MLEQLTNLTLSIEGPVILIVCGLFLGVIMYVGVEYFIDYSICKANIYGVTADDLDPEMVAQVNSFMRLDV